MRKCCGKKVQVSLKTRRNQERGLRRPQPRERPSKDKPLITKPKKRK